jgi:hypothetical protein
VREILLELGARPDLKAIAGGCEPSGRPSPFPSVRLVISTPVEATPENLAKLSDAGGRNAGITRPSRKKAAESSPAEQFPASWRTVQLTQLRPKLRLQPGECELIEELRDQVFPKLGIRVVEDHTRCVPHQMSPGQPNTTVAALVSLPQPDIAKAD